MTPAERERWDKLIRAQYDRRIKRAEAQAAVARTPAERRKYATQAGSLKAWARVKCAA